MTPQTSLVPLTPSQIQDYINKFYTLLESVYNTNKLIINKDKTNDNM